MKRWLLISCIVVSSAAAAQNCGSPEKSWTHCLKDDECVLAPTACEGWGAFHRQFLSAVQKYNLCVRPAIKCAPYKGKDKSQLSAMCAEGGTCVVTPKSEMPKPMKAIGTGNACKIDADCSCRVFTGAQFLPGRSQPGRCGENHKCLACLYD